MTDAAVFSSALWRARERKLTVGELLSTVGHLVGEPSYAAELYRTWLEQNGDDPLIFAMYFNYAVILSGLGDLAGARHALEEAIRINPDFYPPYINLGHVLERQGEVGLAAQQWYACAGRLAAVNGDNVNYRTAALKQVGRLLERVNWDAHAEDALRQSLEIHPNQSDVIQHWVSLRQRQCKWPVMAPWANITRKHLLQGISSLSLCAYTDDPLFQLTSAYVYAKDDVGRPPLNYLDRHAALRLDPPRRRRIGYLSSDFREHAVGYLTTEMFALHDREKVEVFLYYCGIDAKDDPLQKRIKGSSEHWRDISPLSDQAAAEQILTDKIEILIDLNGYTNGARSKMLAMCPAPIIVNWLGYPGSLGSPFHNYIIADEFIIPPGDEAYYSEKVLRIPCYQPNNRKRPIAEHRPTREEAGLPPDTVIYCCFNGAHKITPFTWARWMKILKAVPNSVLWLLDTIPSTNTRLKELAAAHGVMPERILFAPKLRNERHLARYPLADIFLDTVPYGAHTTSSDALWMGVPVITLAGRSFPARVCGSLIKSAGLSDLICTTGEQFVQLAVELGLNRERRQHYRDKLAAERDTCVLFDTQLLVSSLEGVYDEMWADFMNDRVPRPDLSNLDLYNEIGIAIDRDDVELTSVPDYRALYRERLTEYHRYNYLRPDARLWQG
jgi:predicted O-linked N-acetylglucosamine transferase (SPINDLY family)